MSCKLFAPFALFALLTACEGDVRYVRAVADAAGASPDATPPATPDAQPPTGTDAAPEPELPDARPGALGPPAPPPPLPPEAETTFAIDDAEWPDPSLTPPPPPSVPGDAPLSAAYGVLPEGWDAAARERWSPENTPRSILTLGDSISESEAFIAEARWDPTSGVSTAEGYVHLPKSLGALAGQESGWGAEIVEAALTEGRPETATILFGTNDARHGYDLAAYTDHMRALVEACIARGTLPILLTPPPLNGDVAPVAELAATVSALADAYDVPLFDLQRLLVDRGQLAADLPDGIHPSAEAYAVITAEWIRLYKQVEFAALAPRRAEAPPVDPFAADLALVWTRVFDRTFDSPEDAGDLDVERGRWAVVESGGTRALGGRAAAEDFAILRLPVRVPGPVRVEVVAASDGAEISLIAHNAADPFGTDGWYFGWGTNGGARTGLVFQDALVAELPGERPAAARWANVRVANTPKLARWGTDGTYRLTYRTRDEVLAAANDRVGFYVWGGTMYVRRVVVWAGRAP
jgi:lysophospholipase L1-like esterase